MHLTLTELPPSTLGMLKAATTVTRKPRGEIKLPALSVSLAGLRIDAANLKAYRDICGFSDDGALPIPYPQVIAAPMHIYLMNQKEFPLPLLGSVHLRNKITQTRSLSPDETYGVTVTLGEGRQTDKGFDFDLLTSYADEKGVEVWKAVTTILYRNRPLGGGAKKPPPKVDAVVSEYAALKAPADIGRRYGAIAGDRNPIHLWATTAKLFGFPRAIAHGMWSMAQCTAHAQKNFKQPVRELSVQFKQPLLLPSKAAIKVVPTQGGLDYSLLGDGGKVYLAGTMS